MKPVPFRHRPKGMEILYEDMDVIVIDKEPGLLTVRANYEKEKTAHQILTSYVRRGDCKSKKQVFVVHRLDRETSGVLVFAKSFNSMENLKQQWGKTVKKKYLAVVHGILKEKAGTITSYLAENDDYRVFSVKDQQRGELAITAYKVLKESKNFSLLEIDLVTGKKNQIRVHLSEKGHPIVNDDKYGRDKSRGRLALHSQSLTFNHPYSGRTMTFEAKVPEYFHSYNK
ncbi:MAG: RNA pseudouridine synthase [Lentisphaerae bacterium GWF2_49_21]|nr:MAG: RNA pseudouridine synthase [Lentisphaerae bacterium GWF2_49_21]